jgi:hypothetical protein
LISQIDRWFMLTVQDINLHRTTIFELGRLSLQAQRVNTLAKPWYLVVRAVQSRLSSLAIADALAGTHRGRQSLPYLQLVGPFAFFFLVEAL